LPYDFSAEVDGYSVDAWAATATYANDQLHILAGLKESIGKKPGMIYIYVIASKPGEYSLFDDQRYDGGNNAGYAFGDKSNRVNFITNSQYTGKIKITELDVTNKKVSGTFEFTAVEISSGRYGTRVARITGGTFSDIPIKSELTLVDKK
jgi:hypothetical protein